MISGESGTGKSVALRIVAQRLSALRDVMVGVVERPQSKSADFYRELGDIFSVQAPPVESLGWLSRPAGALEGPCGCHAHQAGAAGG